jgi:hypothetical protein
MWRRLVRFNFERESHWMLILYVLIPLLLLILAIVLPGLWRRWVM